MRACQERIDFLQFRAHAQNEYLRASPIWSAAALATRDNPHVTLRSLFDRLKKATLKDTRGALLGCDFLPLCLFGVDSEQLSSQDSACCKYWYDRFRPCPPDGSLAALTAAEIRHRVESTPECHNPTFALEYR